MDDLPYGSSMCSRTEGWLAAIGAAIDELAQQTSAATGAPAAPEDVAQRLADLWAMVADLDPELAQRLPGYTGAGE